MQKRSWRILSTIIAIIISSMIVYGLSHVGKSTKGPIENAISYTGDAVKGMEQKLIAENRPDKRKDKLAWLQPYIANKKLLEHPDRILLGAFDNEAREDFESVVSLEDSLKTTFPLIHIFTAWGMKQEEKFPTERVNNVLELGSIPVITWEPWLTDFNEEEFPSGSKAERDKNGMRDVAAGMYDSYVIKWARSAREIGKPFFVRFGHEMNDGYRYPWGPQNNTAEDYIAAWRHVHDLFVKHGARNVIWIWSPHPAYEFKDFYPGDAYVDYVGVGVLNYGTVAKWSKWWSFREIFGKYYGQFASYRKPIMITEFGSLAVGGNRERWYANALDSMPQRYPLVKGLMFFHVSKDNTTTQQTLSWYIKDDSATRSTVISAVTNWRY